MTSWQLLRQNVPYSSTPPPPGPGTGKSEKQENKMAFNLVGSILKHSPLGKLRFFKKNPCHSIFY